MTMLEKARQLRAAINIFASNSADTLTDAQALDMGAFFPVWPAGVNEEGKYTTGKIVQDEGQLYRVMQDVTPIESQPPHGEGMLAVYRPINPEHAGTQEDPIPWVYGMDCFAGKYYSYEGTVYRVASGGDMIPCVWAPGTPGLWQWEVVSSTEEPVEPSQYPAWEDMTAGTALSVGSYFTYQGKTYRVLRAMTVTPGWEPPALLGDFYEEVAS